MIRFILVTFLFLGWAFFELSGGSAFVAEEQSIAATDSMTTEVEGIEIVTRGADPTLASLAVPQRLTQPLIEPAVAPAAPVADDLAADVAAVLAEVAAEPTAPDTVPAESGATDLREVAGTRVNMRTGPGTGYGVVTTLDGGTRAQVIDSDPSGWVKLRVDGTGLEGWMAARLLAPVEG